MITSSSSSSLFFQKEGHGSHSVLLFHGFGQTHQAFSALVAHLSKNFTCYSFDLYFHGNSRWNEDDKPLTKDDWKKIVGQFLKEQSVSSFSIIGFSLGGKLALATVEAYPEKTSSLILLAPDGIKTNFWYSLATFPFVFRRIFKSMILHPDRFFNLAKAANAIGLVDKGLIRFASSQMDTQEKRQRVYDAWTTFRLLSFDMKKMGDLINRNHIATIIIAGEYDKVIVPNNMNRLLRHLDIKNLLVVATGHNGLLTHQQVIDQVDVTITKALNR